MNRNEYLIKALPTWLEKGISKVVIVDWSSKNTVLEDLRKTYAGCGKITIVRVDEQIVFRVSEARNLAADFCKTPYMWLVDSDVTFTFNPERFIKLNPNVYYQGSFLSTGAATTGTCLMTKEAFDKVNGYSEFIETLPGEDLDLYKRLRKIGIRRKLFPIGSLKHIYHPYELRYKFRPWFGMSRAKATVVAHSRELWTPNHKRTDVPYDVCRL